MFFVRAAYFAGTTNTISTKNRVTVRLAAKGDGTKLKPFIVFKGGKRDVEKLKKEYVNKCVITSSTNGWMDTDFTLSWANTVLGQFSFRRRLLAWDTYECHLMPVAQKSLLGKKIDTVLVPGGCTKYIQAPPNRHKTSSRHLRIVLELSCLDKTSSRYLQDIFM